MDGLPVLGLAGYSGSGKTTLIEKLLPALRRRGLRVAVLKHDGHDFAADRAGSDSWRFTRAGAALSCVSSAQRTQWVEERPLTLAQLLARVRDVDLVLAEGFKREAVAQLGLARAASGKGLPADASRYAALVTDAAADGEPPRFGFDDIEPLADFIAANRDGFTHYDARSGGFLPGAFPEG